MKRLLKKKKVGVLKGLVNVTTGAAQGILEGNYYL